MASKGRELLRPALPANLLKQMGLDGEGTSSLGRSRGGQRQTSRKERRKQERVQRRQRSVPLRTITGKSPGKPTKSVPHQTPKSISQKPANGAPRNASNSKLPTDIRMNAEPDFDNEIGDDDEGGVLGGDADDFYGFSGDEDDDSEDGKPTKIAVSKVTMDKLARDDAEIAALEKKLGIKSKRSLPKSFEEDGLGDLLRELDDESENDGYQSAKRKRKADADEWLAHKRRKALQQQTAKDSKEDVEDSLSGLDDVEGSSDSGNEGEDRDGDGDGEYSSDSDKSEAGEVGTPVRKRENPYVAPTTARAPAQKYVPPARRQESGSDAELLSRIRRQTQGLINRLTESNLLVLLGDIEKLYRDYPRQHVTSILIDLILIQVCEPTALPDTLLILNAGFSTAVHQIIGADFGAQLLQRTVERFKDYHQHASTEDAQNAPKYTSNLITFMSEMYNFQLIGCNVVFDYIRLLLSDLSELHAELLLRIVRMAGQSLRRDDPLALKDIVALIGPAVKKIGEANLSVRTKFMIETINDLKNNKVKTGASASAVVLNHTTRMKKLLGSLNTRKLKATEPLRISLKDIEDSDKTGKWWLIGASWAGRDGDTGKVGKGHKTSKQEEEADGDSSSSDGEDLPDLGAIAREQNMNTDVRRSIFIAIMSASDYENAYARLMKLRLSKDRQKEIAYVVMQCAGGEKQYNPYYALLARRVCGDRRVRFAFQDSLWKFFRRLGEATFGEDTDDMDEDEDESIDACRILALAKMFGFLVAHGALGLTILKCLNLAYVRPKTRDFLEVMFITLFLEVANKNTADQGVSKLFGAVADMPELAKGLQHFLKKRVRRSDLFAGKKDAKQVKKGCDVAVEALSAAPEKTQAEPDFDDMEE